MMSLSSVQRPKIWMPLLLLSFLVFVWSVRRSEGFDTANHEFQDHHKAIHDSHFPDALCPEHPLTSETLVVLRTSATESNQKLPTHFRGILRCIPNYVIYSDRNELVTGHRVSDVLEDVSLHLRKNHPDFEMYRQMQLQRRRVPQYNMKPEGDDGDGHSTNPAGLLDKWKQLPMMVRALEQAPGAKWYVFIEADTFLVWENLMLYLEHLDAQQSMYIATLHDDREKKATHGGEGLVVSNVALAKVVAYYKNHKKELENLTASEQNGKAVVNHVMREIGIKPHTAWPSFQDQRPYALDPTKERFDTQPWCYGAITYHYMNTAEIEELWDYLQVWFKNVSGSQSTGIVFNLAKLKQQNIFRHKHMFFYYIMPRMQEKPRADWDNLSNEVDFSEAHYQSLTVPERDRLDHRLRVAYHSPAKCQKACRSQEQCYQYTWGSDKTCFLSTGVTYGQAQKSGSAVRKYSGWMPDRVNQLAQQMDRLCAWQGDWILP